MSSLQDLENLLAKIKAGQAPRLLLIYGDQAYLVKQAYDRVLEALVPEELRAFNLEQLDGSQVEVDALLSAWEIVPMMPGPKALGVPEARFFQSKSNGIEILKRGKEAWEAADWNLALRQLARALALLEWSWETAQGKSASEIAQALQDEDGGEGAFEGPWLERALAQGLSSAFPLPRAADESEELLEALKLSLLPLEGEAGRSLVFACHSADARKKIYRFVQEQGLILDFKTEAKGPQSNQTATVFLRQLLQQRGLQMATDFGQRFISIFGHELGLLVQELEKLEAYAYPRKLLTPEDLLEVGSPQPEDNVFELLNEISKRGAGLKGALKLLERLLEEEPAQKIFALLAKEIRLLHISRLLLDEQKVGTRLPEYFQYKSNLHPKLLKELPAGLAALWKAQHPFVSFKSLQRARQFQVAELRELLKELLEADLRMKSSEGHAEEELRRLCVRMAGVREEVFV